LARWVDRELAWCKLGAFPTPVEPLDVLLPELGAGRRFIKRDDLTSKLYGGNKVRALEPLLGSALGEGAQIVYSAGACGSHSVLATTLHAAALGLEPRAIVFPQPVEPAARENLRHALAHCTRVVALPHWSALPVVSQLEQVRATRHGEMMSMLPAATASPLGALGHVSAALELAEQVGRGELPRPEIVVLGLGSGCTSAGLLLGFWLAARWGLPGWSMPRVVAVRVAPRPLATKPRVLALALQAARLLGELRGRREEVPRLRDLAGALHVDGSQLGAGYGRATQTGQRALQTFRELGLNPLETTYSAKIAAGFIEWTQREPPMTALLWATHSSAPLPEPGPPRAPVPWLLERWLRDTEPSERAQ
jgi:1-aminocyclopropane-1-carboxylate deaminase/D-cysteine desulfhydrase-like pyridoxal-dependent ACC family enzyme